MQSIISEVTGQTVWWALFAILNLAFIFQFYVDWRQHKAISRPDRPKELKEICTEEEYAKSHDYSLDRSTFGLFESFIHHLCGLGLLFGGSLFLVWNVIGVFMSKTLTMSPEKEIIRSLLFQGVFLLVSTVQSLPFSIYRTFWLESRHGFNKTTVRTFVLDLVKSLLVGVIVGGILLTALLWIIMRTGHNFVMWTCILLLVFQLVMTIIYPSVIQPLFNKFTPLEEGELREKINALANRVNFPLRQIFVVDGSTRSTHSNAYFFGLFKNKRIVLYDTLISQMSSDEVVAVVAHELGHWSHNHMLHGLIVNQINILWMFYLFSLAIGYAPIYEAFGFTKSKPIIIGLSLFFHLLTPLSLVVVFFMTWLSRKREFEADRFAVRLGYEKLLPSALIKMYNENKSLIHPDWLYSIMHYSHPPPSERLAAMREYAATLKKED